MTDFNTRDFVKVREFKVKTNGETSLMITMPQFWCKEHNVKKGDGMGIYRAFGFDGLILIPEVKFDEIETEEKQDEENS